MKMNDITAEEFDILFDNGECATPYMDPSTFKRPNKLHTTSFDLPLWLIEAIEEEAEELGITKDKLVKKLLWEKLDHRAFCGIVK